MSLQCFNTNAEVEKEKVKNSSEKLDNNVNLEHFIFYSISIFLTQFGRDFARLSGQFS